MFLILILLYVQIMNSSCLEVGNEIEWTDSNTADSKANVYEEVESKTKGSRKPKFLTFNNDASNIRVEMVFAIPFLAIPIGGKNVATPQGTASVPHVDINVKSIMAMAGIMIMLFFIIPKFVALSLPQRYESESYSTSQEGTFPSYVDTILSRVDEALHMHNIDMESCAQKALCWTLNGAESKIRMGKANSFEKILDILSNFTWLKSIFGGNWMWTLLETALEFSRKDGTCRRFSEKCSLTQHGLNNAAGSLLAAMKKMDK